jgi:hypothetical protein
MSRGRSRGSHAWQPAAAVPVALSVLTTAAAVLHCQPQQLSCVAVGVPDSLAC